MKIKESIIIILGIIISNAAFSQDTTETRLVDKYYPKSENPTPEPENKITPISRNEPLNNSPVQQKPVINNNPISGSVVAQPTQVPDTKTNDINIADPVTTVPETDINPQQQKPVVKNDPIISQPTQPSVSHTTPIPAITTTATGHVYRDTRLGSSSPQYNTYEKNDYGAGAVTTNPNKNGGGAGMEMNNPSTTEPATQNSVQYRDRLGSSSPLYNTYEKNSYGAGSVTTSPK
jgi:hypothetical protein